MPGITWQLDPTSEDATNTPLDIVDGTTYVLLEEDLPDPELDAQYASSVDTEGDPLADQRYRNTTETIKVRVYATTYQNLQTAIYALQQKAGKVKREGGTAKRTLPSGTAHVKDIIKMRVRPENSKAALVKFRDTVTITFESLPGWRAAAETSLTLHSETTLPCLVFTETAIKGDLPAEGRLVITDAQGADQWHVMWGMQSRNYSASADAALFYQAESRTPMGSSATAVGAAGASGAGSNVVRNTDLSLAYQALLSTQAAAAGNHLSHVGDFVVWARVQVPTTNAGAITLALEWAQADLSAWTRNTAQTIDASRDGTWVLVPLGQVHLARAVKGTQRWEGRIVGKSSSIGDDIDIDCLMIVPVEIGYGEARGLPSSATPATFLARDEFNQSAGALSAKALPVGGTWTTVAVDASGTVDYAVDAVNHVLTRTDVAGGLRARAAHNGTDYTSLALQCDIQTSTVSPTSYAAGVLARYVDTSNFLYIEVAAGGCFLFGKVAAALAFSGAASFSDFTPGQWVTVKLVIDTAGRWTFSVGDQGSEALTQRMSGQTSHLATGGALATGKAGIYDSVGPVVRNWDNIRIWNPASDAAIFASRSLEIRSDQTLRQSSDAAGWRASSKYEGNYLHIPPAGREGRTLRVFAKASRNDPYDLGADSNIDDLSAQLFYTPRYLVLPE